MKRFVIGILISLCSQTNFGIAQNLVPNPSFENYSICPSSYAQIYRATGWFQPHKYIGSNSVITSSSSDYFNTCVFSLVSVPLNYMGYQQPKSGNGYIGLSLYTPFNSGNAYREYAEVMLVQELIANRKYNLKYYISFANGSRFSITKFDAYFSNDSLLYSSNDLYKIPVTPQIQYNLRVNDTLNWVEIQGNFIASGGERFLTLGNFQDGSVCDTVRTNISSVVNSAYYIDDVSLEEDTITGINEISNTDFNIYPNPASSKIRVCSMQSLRVIKVLDLQRKEIKQFTLNGKNAEIELLGLENGIYFVECSFIGGETITKKIVVQH